jgi:hypothetical protein
MTRCVTLRESDESKGLSGNPQMPQIHAADRRLTRIGTERMETRPMHCLLDRGRRGRVRCQKPEVICPDRGLRTSRPMPRCRRGPCCGQWRVYS